MKNLKIFEKIIMLLPLLILLNCSGERNKYRNDLSGMVDNLCLSLNEFNYRDVVNNTKAIQNHFSNFSLAFLREDIEGFDDWAEDIKKDINQHRATLYNEIQFFKSRYEDKQFSLRQTNLGVYAKLTDNKELYFVTDDGDYCAIEKLFKFNLENWLKSVKKQSKKYQK